MIALHRLTNGFKSGSSLCVHVNSYRNLHSIKEHTTRLADRNSISAKVGRSAEWSGVIAKWIGRNATARWLSRNAGITSLKAQSLIERAPLRIHPRLTYNAADPRKLLGIMSAIEQAELLMYDTIGNSPAGMNAIHAYVAEYFATRCVIHLAMSGTTSFEHQCPPGAMCVDLHPDSE